MFFFIFLVSCYKESIVPMVICGWRFGKKPLPTISGICGMLLEQDGSTEQIDKSVWNLVIDSFCPPKHWLLAALDNSGTLQRDIY